MSVATMPATINGVETVVSVSLSIEPVHFSAIFNAPNAADLFRAYAKACIVADAEPQRSLYEAMDRAGVLHCFAAYMNTPNAGPDRPNNPVLIGFSAVICGIMPHDGHLVATISEMFVDPPYRSTGAADRLLCAIEKLAEDRGCRCLVSSARQGSAYDIMLGRRPGYTRTHAQHTKWLNGYEGGWRG